MWLLDGNLLVALAIDTHEFHQRAQRWFNSKLEQFATCSITEGTLLRVHMQLAQDRTAAAAWSILEAIHAMPDHVFWNDGFSYREIPFANISGSKQVTDAWLAELARRHGSQLATLDAGLAALHPDISLLIPV
ncbi:MAG TPA: TA system VapC family ribonuclease toxin [Pyrinomonadaceae bacterium]|nr:TA system VapC family ribonuclease toxin [Pyrinomonadaceae bacterium]